mgnify:CR=1 FL=1
MQRKERPLHPRELKEWRAKHGLSQTDAADWFKVSARTYQGWEHGRRKKQADLIREMMRKKRPPAPPPPEKTTLFD